MSVASTELHEKLSSTLHRVFGHREFRPHQQQVCEAAAAGRDVLLVMPTGAGKSLCYQLPALVRGQALPSSGPALVVSPLIALMDDQANKLSELGVRVARIHSGLGRDQARQACRAYLDGQLDFLFIAPERMRVPGFAEMLAKRTPSLVAIDEAHCISQWGHDFRPDYRTLGGRLPGLRPAPIVALTATATPTVQRDIVAQLNFVDPAVFITGFRRENLAVETIELSKAQRAEFVVKMLKEASARPAIVYAASRKAAEELADMLNKHFPARAYHAGLEPSVRDRVQRDFLTGKLEVVVATVAFGMGVDKADVRTVVHVALPGSVEAYYQEIGRAGRDGKVSRTVLLYSFADRKTLEFFLEKNYPAVSDVERVQRALSADYVDVGALQRKLRMEREVVERSLEKLLGNGLADANMNDEVRAAAEGQTNGWRKGYEAQVNARREQIDRMIAYAEGHTCRMLALIRHFGDATDAAGPCGRCDVCDPRSGTRGNDEAAGHAPDAAERETLRAILRALEGRGQSTGKLFTDLKVCEERKDFDGLLDALARAGLLALANESWTTPEGKDVTFRKATITHEGREPDDRALATVWIRGAAVASKRGAGKRGAGKAQAFAKTGASSREQGLKKQIPIGNDKAKLERPAMQSSYSNESAKPVRKAPSVSVELNATQSALEETLKQWRRETARKAGLPSFFILSDTALRNVVLARPASLADLRSIHGIGADKTERFGADVVAMCRA